MLGLDLTEGDDGLRADEGARVVGGGFFKRGSGVDVAEYAERGGGEVASLAVFMPETGLDGGTVFQPGTHEVAKRQEPDVPVLIVRIGDAVLAEPAINGERPVLVERVELVGCNGLKDGFGGHVGRILSVEKRAERDESEPNRAAAKVSREGSY